MLGDIIASIVVGGGALYILYHVAMILSFLAFGDEPFSWTGLAQAGIFGAMLAGGVFLAYGLGHLILCAV